MMEKATGKPQVFVVVVLYAASLDALKLVGSRSSIRTASLTSVGNSRLLGSVVGSK